MFTPRSVNLAEPKAKTRTRTMWKPKPCPSLSHGWNRNAAKRGVFGPWGIFRKHIDRQTCLRKPVCSTFVRVSSSIKTLVAPQNRTMSNPREDGQSTPWQENLRISWTRPKGDRLCGELQVCAFFTFLPRMRWPMTETSWNITVTGADWDMSGTRL